MIELRDLIEKTDRFLHTTEYVLADGDVDRGITKEEAEELLQTAQDFVQKVKNYLNPQMRKEGGK